MNTPLANAPVQTQASTQPGCNQLTFDTETSWSPIRPEDFPGKATADILYIDEHLQMLEIIAAYFRGQGLTVITASSAEAAMRLPDEWQVGVMIIDADFANNGGTQLTRYLRANHPTTPIVLRIFPEQSQGLGSVARRTYCVSKQEPLAALLTTIAGVTAN